MPRPTLALKSTVTSRNQATITPDMKVRLNELQQHQAAVSAEHHEHHEYHEPDQKQPPKRIDPHVLQTAFLNANLGKPIACFLVSGIRLTGKLKQFDQYTLLLQGVNSIDSLIFKHAVASLQTLKQS